MAVKRTVTGSRDTAELALLRRIRGRIAGKAAGDLRLGIGDDCALLRTKAGEEIAVTTDLSIEGRHFRLDWHPAEAIGHRTLARGLSDLAAMGARPVAAFLSLGLPPELTRAKGKEKPWPRPWVDRFYDGLLALAEASGVPLAGGDLSQSPLALADIVLVGAVRRGHALLRSGAQPGDLIYVTGKLGGAAAGLELLAAAQGKPLRPSPKKSNQIPIYESALGPHLYPQPRLQQGQFLARRQLATAAMDLSDGLSIDLPRICAESAVAAELDADRIPLFPGATLHQALSGGEDYELLFTARPTAKLPASIRGVPVTAIGRILKPRKGRATVTLVANGRKQPLVPAGWEHFSG